MEWKTFWNLKLNKGLWIIEVLLKTLKKVCFYGKIFQKLRKQQDIERIVARIARFDPCVDQTFSNFMNCKHLLINIKKVWLGNVLRKCIIHKFAGVWEFGSEFKCNMAPWCASPQTWCRSVVGLFCPGVLKSATWKLSQTSIHQ